MRFFFQKYIDLQFNHKKKNMKHSRYTGLLGLLLLLASCGEDRTGEFYALIEDRMWMEEVMRENYLWYNDIPAIENENDYFAERSVFFKSLLSKEAMDGKGDPYSYMEESPEAEAPEAARGLTLTRTSTYGIEFELVSDPLQTTTHTFARVLYVLPQSPAAQAGLKRGDWISAIDARRITSDNYTALQQGGTVRLATARIVAAEGGYAWQATDTLTVAPSVSMEINPFMVDSVYQADGRRIAYLMYNEFATGPNNDGTESVYNEQMKQIFGKFKAQSPDAFILDLRYNPGGYLHCAQALGSLLAPAAALGQDFITLEYNDKDGQAGVSYPFDTALADANLDLKKIYILTGSYTASASEAVINGLKPWMGSDNVVLLGEKTVGKNVAMQAFENTAYGFTLWPVVARVFNARHEGDYGEGIAPRYNLTERQVIDPWYELGDTREYLLKNALSLITAGTLADEPTAESRTACRPIPLRKAEGIRIR